MEEFIFTDDFTFAIVPETIIAGGATLGLRRFWKRKK
jgi:hypothetical protein